MKRLLVTLARGLGRACPRCGRRGIFVTYFTLRVRCPNCRMLLDREDGYWTGAIGVNLAVTEAVFGLAFGGGILFTWPDVPWTALLIGALLLNAVVPIVFYPMAKTIWLGLDGLMHRMDPLDTSTWEEDMRTDESPIDGTVTEPGMEGST